VEARVRNKKKVPFKVELAVADVMGQPDNVAMQEIREREKYL
jgi:hypothetical protein